MKISSEEKNKKLALDKKRELHHKELVKKQDEAIANLKPYEGDAFISLQHVNKIKNYFKFYKEYSETKTKTPMFEAVVTSWADRFDSKEGRV